MSYWIQTAVRLAMTRDPPMEALFLGAQGMAELVEHVERNAELLYDPLRMDPREPKRVVVFMGLPVVPIRSAPPWRVEVHARDYMGEPRIEVLR